MRLLVPSRVDTDELLDEHDAPRADMERSLRDLQRINRWLGGVAIYRRMLRRLLSSAVGGHKVRILDLGTGTSDLLEAASRDRPIVGIGLDFKIEHLLYRKPQSSRAKILPVVGDATRLPFRDGSVDVVTSAHFFHHFGPDENVNILTESLRVARVGVAVNDTQRHRIPLLTIQLLGALRLVGRITRFDGPASVMRAYTPREAREVAGRVPGAEANVKTTFPFRFIMLLRKRP